MQESRPAFWERALQLTLAVITFVLFLIILTRYDWVHYLDKKSALQA